MVIQPHDLLLLKEPLSQLRTESVIPDWVNNSLNRTPFVVVRRAPLVNGCVPIGVRGAERNQRFAAFVAIDAIVNHILPEQLVEKKVWKKNKRATNFKAFHALELTADVLRDFRWGPVGSVGFELASGQPTIHEESDLDIVIRGNENLTVTRAQEIITELEKAPVRIDSQFETGKGGFSLIEYSRGTSSLMLRTIEGPKLVKSPF
ncbi:malonate decarboxylase holo-ACP synthase [Thalassobacillus sp. CUG 92003]|uniref:malonate decarboxylase holo-ACP synthase n=1 Tax=Thalassobacillus sp. CUG 92003 TaxID=2736641 RepID=UPI0015E76B1D|nr:malonate decarboxylase holo-ACP synthase [Thalassobacillus sp. CUG 92003]